MSPDTHITKAPESIDKMITNMPWAIEEIKEDYEITSPWVKRIRIGKIILCNDGETYYRKDASETMSIIFINEAWKKFLVKFHYIRSLSRDQINQAMNIAVNTILLYKESELTNIVLPLSSKFQIQASRMLSIINNAELRKFIEGVGILQGNLTKSQWQFPEKLYVLLIKAQTLWIDIIHESYWPPEMSIPVDVTLKWCYEQISNNTK